MTSTLRGNSKYRENSKNNHSLFFLFLLFFLLPGSSVRNTRARTKKGQVGASFCRSRASWARGEGAEKGGLRKEPQGTASRRGPKRPEGVRRNPKPGQAGARFHRGTS